MKRTALILTALLLALTSCGRGTVPTTTTTGTVQTTTTTDSDPSTTTTGSNPSTASASTTTEGTTEETTTEATTETTTEETTAAMITPVPEEPSPTLDPEGYDTYSNSIQGWWYGRPATLGEGLPAEVDEAISTLLADNRAIWQMPAGQKVVYLTMDEGYEYETNTVQILDIAADKGVPITFFVTGAYIDSKPELVLRMLDEGHQVGNHTQDHLRANEALDESIDTFLNDIQSLEADFEALTGRPITRLYRPPEGNFTERSLHIMKDLGYTTVFWSFAYQDWVVTEQPDPVAAFNQVMGELHDGSILLLHAVSKTNVEILPDLIDAIREAGYTFVRLEPLDP